MSLDRRIIPFIDYDKLIRLARYLGIGPKNTREELEEAVIRTLDLIERFPQFAKLHDNRRLHFGAKRP